MTTVAWRDGVLAADKKASEDETGFTVTKLFRAKSYAVAFYGDLSNGLLFVEWLKKRRGECPLNKNTGALVMELDTGRCYQWEKGGVPLLVEDRFLSCGTGAAFAIGAMAMGATAIEAVEVASEWDNNSGLGINYAKARRIRK